jgi:hypothetical protein
MQTEIDAAIFGTAVHNLLEQLYNRWKQENGNAEITETAIDTMLGWIPEHLDKALQDAWHEEDATANTLSLKGFAVVVADVVVHFTKSFLEIDRKLIPFKVHHTEVSMEHNVGVQTVDGKKVIKLKGNIDRVDEKDGIVRMVDYKTGGDKIEFESLEELWRVHGDKQNKGALQTLLYALMFSKTQVEYAQFEPALVVLRGMKKSGNDNVRLFEKSTKAEMNAGMMAEYLPSVESGVVKVLEELFSNDVAFDQTTDLKICGYCDFKGICGR